MRANLILFVLLMGAFCFPISADVDTDGDGRTDSEELAEGTDPSVDLSFRRVNLSAFRFHEGSLQGNFGQEPLVSQNLGIVQGWDGKGISITSSNAPVGLKYKGVESTGKVNVAPKRGSIWFQIRPYWFSNDPDLFDDEAGLGPGEWVTVLQTANFALRIDPQGTNAVVTSTNSLGQTVTNLTKRISLPAENWFDRSSRSDPGIGYWHYVLLSYSPGEVRLYWGSTNPVTSAIGVRAPSSPSEDWFLSIGSAPDGSGAVGAVIDEVVVFNAEGEVGPNSEKLSAVVSNSPPGINLIWDVGINTVANLKRRIAGEKDWSFVGAFIGTNYFDGTVEPGVRYEYLLKTDLHAPGQINFSDSISITAARLGSAVEKRGKLILLVDESLTNQIEAQLNLYVTNLVGDGWEVLRADVPRHIDAAPSFLTNHFNITNRIAPFILSNWTQFTTNIKQIVIVGHVTVPYSGLETDDGHANHAGAWPADLYYGDVDGIWTDSTNGPASTYSWNQNNAGDGKFDQSLVPANSSGVAELEIPVSRIDFYNLPAFTTRTEPILLGQYLTKNVAYRAGQLSFNQLVLYDDVSVTTASDIPLKMGTSMMSKLAVLGSPTEGDIFTNAASALIGVQSGPGFFDRINDSRPGEERTTTGIAIGTNSPTTAFCFVRGSYLGDWNTENNFLRGILGATNGGLVSAFVNRDRTWRVDGMAAGLTVGNDVTTVANTWNTSRPYVPTPRTIEILGDATLRYPLVNPPTGLTWSPTNNQIRLAWSHPAGITPLYNVYRSSAGILGEFSRINTEPLTSTTFVDSSVTSGDVVYMVRALAIQVTGAGSYTNISQGTFSAGSPAIDPSTCCIPDQVVNEDTATGAIPFNLGDAAGEPGLQISAVAADTALVPSGNIILGGSGASRTISVTPGSNQFGTTAVTVTITTDVRTRYLSFLLTANPVNDAPTFVKGADIVVPQSPAQTTVSWATGISPGPNESGQSVTFNVSGVQSYFYTVPPAISSSGVLTFTPTRGARGTNIVTVQAVDSGGTASGGLDTSEPQSFVIVIGSSDDSDSDGMPNDFELAFGLDPGSQADAEIDSDGDGFTNLEEFRTETDPVNAGSLLEFTRTSLQGTQWKLAFPSVPGKRYTIQYNDSFPTGTWQSLLSDFPASGTTFEIVDSPGFSGRSNRIYRVTTGTGGETAMSGYAGFHKVNTFGFSDAPFSIPFIRPPEARGVITNISGGNIVEIAGNSSWAVNKWVYSSGTQSNHYFMLIASGALEGDYFEVTANGTNTLTLNLDGGTLAGLLPGDRVIVSPYWTFGTAFPGGRGVHASPNGINRSTEVFLPDLTGLGVNLSPKRTFYFRTTWREFPIAGVKDDEVLLPDTFMWIRNNVTSGTEIPSHGAVLMTKFRVPLRRIATGEQDNPVALPRPGPMTLQQLGLVQSGAFRASSSSVNRTDEAFFYNTDAAIMFRSPIYTYYHRSGVWRLYPTTGAVDDTIVFKPGEGFLLRLDPAATSVMWINEPNY